MRINIGLTICGLLLAGIHPFAQAAENCRGKGPDVTPSSLTLRIDNDLFGGSHQDQGYSNGLMVTAMSPNLADYVNDPCLPRIAQWLNRYLDWLQPGGFEHRNMVAGFGQALFTPNDKEASTLIEDDRPYAAALLFNLGYNARQGDTLRSSHLRLGIVGPSALGREVQDTWHDFIDVTRFNGWNNQLRDEPVFQLIHERMRRHAADPVLRRSNWGRDLIIHWGASLGNLATYANTGAEWRVGWKLPDDFGSTPLRPAGENTAPPRIGLSDPGWTGHLFVNFDARWVLHNITLDGNTFKDSHSVDKRPFVADIGYGLAVTRGQWKFAFARYHRTREFEGQRERPVFGSFTISRRM